MASPTTVDVPGMISAASSINDKASQVQAQESQVQATFTNLMSTWQGQSAVTYAGAMDGFYGLCDKIIATLQQLSQTVNTSATNYQTRHEDNTSTAANLAANIPNIPALPNF